MATEILFYHLRRQRLEDALPSLLERCLDRGWRVVVQTSSDERRDALDAHLWTFSDESFLPHGTARDGNAALQPILITSAVEDNANGATVRFVVDRAEPPALDPYARAVFLFDDADPEAVSDARRHWRAVKAAGHQATYWKEDERGRWVKQG